MQHKPSSFFTAAKGSAAHLLHIIHSKNCDSLFMHVRVMCAALTPFGGARWPSLGESWNARHSKTESIYDSPRERQFACLGGVLNLWLLHVWKERQRTAFFLKSVYASPCYISLTCIHSAKAVTYCVRFLSFNFKGRSIATSRCFVLYCWGCNPWRWS